MASIINATTSTGLVSSADNSGSLQLATNNGTTALTIDTSQNVGIGTSSPTDNLYISRATNSAGGISVVNTNNAQASQIAQLYLQGGDNAYAQIKLQASSVNSSIRGNNDGSLAFLSSTTERMRITSGGSVCIGTTTPLEECSLTLQRASTSTSTRILSLYNSAATSTTKAANPLIRMATNGSGADVNIQMSDAVANNYIYGGNNGGAYVQANSGGVRLSSGGTAWASDSDERLKDIIEPITDAVNKVSTLRAVIGKYKTDEEDKRRSFLIAQDVQKVLPEAVVAQPDEIGTLTLAYTETIPLLVAAIKELNAKVDAQAVRIAELEGAK